MAQQRTMMAFCVLAFLSIASAQPLSNHLERFDRLMDRGKIQAAKQLIDSLLSLHPNSYPLLWRAARAWIVYGETLPTEEQQERAYNQAKRYADQAIRHNPKGMEGYIYRAAANGKIALFRGVFSVGDVVAAVRDDAEKAIALNNSSSFMLALAHYILGRTHLKLAEKPKLLRLPLGLGWGNIDDALSHLRMAVQLDSTYIRFRLDYARALLEDDQEEAARKQLQRILQLPSRMPEDPSYKREARQLLKELE